VSERSPRLHDPDGVPPPQNAPHRLDERAMDRRRNRAGRCASDSRPQTLFVAAEPAP
jgi:hypothetical protein